jgi:inward rectifier potassium channel
MKSIFNKNKSESNLGFGSAISGNSRQRLINRNGTFNVKRKGLNYFTSLSLYHSLLEISWFKFFGLAALSYFVLNVIFAFIYLVVGSDAIGGTPSQTLSEHLLNAFFFSVQTSSTIGYGHLIPGNTYANIVVTVESFIGLLGVAIITGLLFARFSKPSAKILFSENALIAPYKDKTSFQFRIVNARENQLLEMEAEVNLLMFTTENNKRVRSFTRLDLEITKLTFFPLSWTIVHPIDKDSPLYNLNEEELVEADPELFILLKGVDDTFNQYVYSRSSYKISEIVYGAKFESLFDLQTKDMRVTIDIAKLSEFNKVEL